MGPRLERQQRGKPVTRKTRSKHYRGRESSTRCDIRLVHLKEDYAREVSHAYDIVHSTLISYKY